MFDNFKKIADIAGTVFGLIVLWDLAKSVARDEVRKEMMESTVNADTEQDSKHGPKVHMDRKDNTIHIRVTR
jgi:hypothetical protein